MEPIDRLQMVLQQQNRLLTRILEEISALREGLAPKRVGMHEASDIVNAAQAEPEAGELDRYKEL